MSLLRSFLSGHRGSAPYAVVFAGGGSRIHGVSGRIAGAALQDIYGGAADGAMRRIQINDNKIDQAIALGAALVASGTVKVEERLLCDIGLEGTLDESLAAELNAKAGVPMLLMPILRRGSKLPATFSSEDFKFDVAVKGGESLDFTIVIDDDPDEPWNQRWKVDVPSSTGHHHMEQRRERRPGWRAGSDTSLHRWISNEYQGSTFARAKWAVKTVVPSKAWRLGPGGPSEDHP